MATFGIPRRPTIVKAEEPARINWRRGLFRIWALVSIAWMMGWTIYLMLHGLRGGLKDSGEVLGIPILLLGPPTALWLAGVAAGWAFRGFSAESEASDH
jgi:hypothetical protein